MRFVFASVAAAVAAVALIGAAAAAGVTWTPFGDGQWQPNVGNPGYGLVTTSAPCTVSPTCPYGVTSGGADASGFPTDPDAITAVSYDFKANQTGASGGSPRMVVEFSDGGSANLRPVAWVANAWTHEDGIAGSDWDNNGGTCGFLYETTWTAVKACHTGSTITAIFVVNDSGWLYTSGEQVILDNLTVNGSVVGGPAVPTNKDDCKDGGWQHLTDAQGNNFKNQGQCVSYSNHN